MRPSRTDAAAALKTGGHALFVAAGLALSAAGVTAQSPALTSWNALQAKRAALPAIHQEFDVEQTITWNLRDTRASKRVEIVDMQGARWRQAVGRGLDARTGIFDGVDRFEIDGNEVIKVEQKGKTAPTPGIYNFGTLDLSKLIEVARRPCGFNANDRPCVVFDAPIKESMTQTMSGVVRLGRGASRFVFDSETGALVSRTTSQMVSRERDGYRVDLVHHLRLVHYDGVPTSLFERPPDLRQVKRFTPWDAKRMNEALRGRSAPDLSVTTLDGATVSLASLKGKTVLLDFWTTWCPPCRADAPALEKLHTKYGSQLAVVGISVNEAREIVEAFLKKNPKSFPIALSSESDLSRVYEVAVFPTYIILDADGNFDTAVEGDKGFDGLRNRLRKAGLEVE
jgi:thiol-disulfide isomerase/thioredoxin